ncbi:MAG TPA: 2-amino-4-hydroxy-6-hydroxymethyldihydropteridine diphosphokinase [Gammaproteobacteria bacterium]
MTAAYVGLGSNLADPVAQVRRALEELADIPETRVTARSPLYRSAPLGSQDQPDYINAVAALDTRLAPLELLASLRDIERIHGRVRDGTRWGPRSLDLDLLLYGDVAMDTPELSLPHPGLPERAFVLYPLFDIAPQLAVPGKGTVRELRDRLGSTDIARLEP